MLRQPSSAKEQAVCAEHVSLAATEATDSSGSDSATLADLASDVSSYLDNQGTRLPTIKAILPAIKKKMVEVIRTRPVSRMPRCFCDIVAVNGQAEMPDNKANQPFVRGSGPLVSRSSKPPPPATIAHTQAATQASPEINLCESTVFFSGWFSIWSVCRVVMNGSTQDLS